MCVDRGQRAIATGCNAHHDWADGTGPGKPGCICGPCRYGLMAMLQSGVRCLPPPRWFCRDSRLVTNVDERSTQPLRGHQLVLVAIEL